MGAMAILARIRRRLEDLAINTRQIALARAELRTHFVVDGRELPDGLDLIETRYPGMAQPGDTVSGCVGGRLEVWQARRDGRTGVRWRRCEGVWTPALVDELRSATSHVVTVGT